MKQIEIVIEFKVEDEAFNDGFSPDNLAKGLGDLLVDHDCIDVVAVARVSDV